MLIPLDCIYRECSEGGIGELHLWQGVCCIALRDAYWDPFWGLSTAICVLGHWFRGNVSVGGGWQPARGGVGWGLGVGGGLPGVRVGLGGVWRPCGAAGGTVSSGSLRLRLGAAGGVCRGGRGWVPGGLRAWAFWGCVARLFVCSRV